MHYTQTKQIFQKMDITHHTVLCSISEHFPYLSLPYAAEKYVELQKVVLRYIPNDKERKDRVHTRIKLAVLWADIFQNWENRIN